MQNNLQKFLKPVYRRKTEHVQILFNGVFEKICAKFLCKNCAEKPESLSFLAQILFELSQKIDGPDRVKNDYFRSTLKLILFYSL